MTSKDQYYVFNIINGLLFIGGVTIFLVILSRGIPPPALGPEAHHDLIQKMSDIHKLKELVIRDNIYIRSLENFVFTSRFILLFSSAVGAAFGLLNLALIRRRGSGPRG